MAESISNKLMAIQNELVVPKGRYNEFSHFHYRNVEDILAAAKPICKKYGCSLRLTDSIKLIGERYYVEATAILSDGEAEISTTASAREEAQKKGFDSAQITGSASSYARKYALNGLFDLDDSNDPDTGEPLIVCPQCGQPVEGFTGRSGDYHDPSDVLHSFGMCLNCYKKVKR